jgi:outer membrane protein assembly factor BamB
MNIFFALLLSILYLNASGQEPSNWRGPGRNGLYNESGLLRKWPENGPTMLWHFNGLGSGFTSVAISSAGIFTTGLTGSEGFVYAFNPGGKLLWKKSYGAEWTENYEGTRSTPHIAGAKLYMMTGYGKVICMDSGDGSILWTRDLVKDFGAALLTWGMTENLLSDGEILYCTPGGKASVVALDRNSGKTLWASISTGEKSAYGSPVLINIKGKKIFITMMENNICGFDAKTGHLLWKHPYSNLNSIHANIPVYNDNMLFCASHLGSGGVMLRIAEDGNSVKELWKTRVIEPDIGGFVTFNGRLFGTGYSNRSISCLDWQTGKLLYSLKNPTTGNIIANDGLIYFYGQTGTFTLLEPGENSFALKGSFKVPYGSGPHWAHPVLNGKKLYLRHGTSLMVYDLAAK